MSGLEHHKTDQLSGDSVQHARTALAQHALCTLNRGCHDELTHPATTVQLDQYQQQIIVSHGLIRAITGHRHHRIKSKTL